MLMSESVMRFISGTVLQAFYVNGVQLIIINLANHLTCHGQL